jgi:thiosulfate/3-mercaptopyruvate sulfurtransferase
MPFTTLISVAQAASHLSDPGWVFVDCRFVLGRPTGGYQAYFASHIKGAVYAHLERDLSGAVKAGISGRHPLPDHASFADFAGSLGIDSEVQAVTYDDSSGAMAAARLWWLLKWAGHESAAVLDGGIAAWRRAGLPASSGIESNVRRDFHADFRPELIADQSAVREMLARGAMLVDSRAADRYRGENETIDHVAGHIPTARSMPYAGNVDKNGKMLPKAELARRFSELQHLKTSEIVFYCGSGVTAAFNILAFCHVFPGLPKLYPGSWSEWINDPSNPVATMQA